MRAAVVYSQRKQKGGSQSPGESKDNKCERDTGSKMATERGRACCERNRQTLRETTEFQQRERGAGDLKRGPDPGLPGRRAQTRREVEGVRDWRQGQHRGRRGWPARTALGGKLQAYRKPTRRAEPTDPTRHIPRIPVRETEILPRLLLPLDSPLSPSHSRTPWRPNPGIWARRRGSG